MSLDPKREYFNHLAARWDELPSAPDAPEKLAEFARLSVPEGVRNVLDVGCGTGLLLEHILRRLCPSGRVVELDVAEEMLARNRGKVSPERASYVCADARRAPFRPESFDLVLCFNALPHMAPIEDAVRELLACLRPGGLLAVGHLMASGELNAFHAGIGGAVAGDRLPAAPHLCGLLRGMGAEVIRQEEAPGWYLVGGRKPA